MSALSTERARWVASAVVVALVVLILLQLFKPSTAADATLLIKADEQWTASEPTALITSSPPTAEARIAVDGIGGVEQPGVYDLESLARMVGAVQSAGEFAPDADCERINLA